LADFNTIQHNFLIIW